MAVAYEVLPKPEHGFACSSLLTLILLLQANKSVIIETDLLVTYQSIP